MTVPCPDRPELRRFLTGTLDAGRTEQISEHVDTCADCRQTIQIVAESEPTSELLGADAPPDSGFHREPECRQAVAGLAGLAFGVPARAAELPASASSAAFAVGSHRPAQAPEPQPPAALGLSVSLDQFRQQLADSRLLSAEEIASCLAGLPAGDPPPDAEQLARHLIREQKLTAYQAQQIAAGQGQSLVLGNYVILDRLGQGGMGLVLKAKHRRMARVVALKVLSPAVVPTPAALRRFQREAQAAARLSHPNIVLAYDADEAGDTHFLVMEYVDGTDLATLVKQQGPLRLDQALDCILQAARGLHYAHQQGVVHRDIKPANLLLSVVSGPLSVAADHGPRTTDHGQQAIVKILDLGLARLESAAREPDELTGSGLVMGTVDYMAPEQARSARHADARADIYSLGATLWYLLTGRPMYTGESSVEKLLAHQTQPIPSLRSIDPEISPALDAVFRRMVAKLPADRYQTMGEVIADLESVQPDSRGTDFQSVQEGTDGLQIRPTGRWDWRKLAAAGAGGLLLIWLGIWAVVRDRDGKEVARVRLPEGGTVTQEPAPREPPRAPLPPWKLPPGAPPPAIAPFGAQQAKEIQAAWAKHLGVEVELKNSLGMRFVLIPPGEFDMGSTEVEAAKLREEAQATVCLDYYIEHLSAETPKHHVRITQPFYLAICEVTQAEYERVVGSNPSTLRDNPTCPVEMVTWDDATAFCRKLSELPQEQTAHAGYRLPTEAEWEYACRAGTTTRWSWGDDAGAFQEHAWISANSAGTTHPVAQKSPNAWGLFDMHGNVWEWCQDYWNERYYATSRVDDPLGPLGNGSRVYRGGSWRHDAPRCRASCRDGANPDGHSDAHGFRLARTMHQRPST